MTGEEKYRLLRRMVERMPDIRNIDATDRKSYSGYEIGFLSFYDSVITVIEVIDNEASINGD